ncbi:MAG: P-loop NTPase [Coriobacteriia bacterium]|nr:P-loop NTPase [Coriobacteriia bacterium]
MKTIVVASGKGGTGKTTLAALFAHLAARKRVVAVADADVEASNLPLALHAHEIMREPFVGGARAEIDSSLCRSCGLCDSVCRFGAISEGANALRVVDPWACEGCGYCARVCVAEAVRMCSSSAGIACLGESAAGPIAYGQLGPGEDLSGKLVTEVRRLGKEIAERESAQLLIVDGPPGVGCPVIAAITNTDLLVAVAEPTISGEHDLSRLVDLASRLGVPVVVVLNKADLSTSGADRIRALAEKHELPLLAEIPFDAALGRALERMAFEPAVAIPAANGEGMRAIEIAWGALESHLGLT